jgi:hypothetical protein
MNARAIVVVALNALGCAIFIVGLLSPLTPSEGMPRLLDIAVFVAAPLLLLATAFGLSRRWPSKLLGAAEMTAILTTTTWLLWLQYRTS